VRWELTGQRDLGFSQWHREACPDDWSIIDIDWCGFCRDCGEPLFLLELAKDSGQAHKTATATKKLAKMAGLSAYVVLYSNSQDGVAQSFRFKRVWPDADATFSEGLPMELYKNIEARERETHKHACDRSLVRFA
jgi:hypothetical protein